MYTSQSLKIKIFLIVIGYSIKTRVMSKKWKKPSPNPRGVEGQNLYAYIFIVREISQLASTSSAKHGFFRIKQVVEIFLCQ